MSSEPEVRTGETVPGVLFVGREWALERVDSWLDGPEHTLLITGGPGSGKSMLASRIAAISAGSAPPVGTGLRRRAIMMSHGCRALDPSRIDPMGFVERVSAAIARVHQPYAHALLSLGDQRIEIQGVVMAEQIAPDAEASGVRIGTLRIGGMSPALAFERVVRGPLSQVAAPAQRLVILVDALDESLTLRADETLVDLIADAVSSGSFPASLRFLMTSRPDSRVLDRFRPTPKFDLVKDAPVRPPAGAESYEALDDIGRYARQRLAARNAPDLERTARRIATAAGGNFLYARYVLDAALACDDLQLTDTALPTGLDDWYRQYLERELVRARERWEDRYRPILGALAVARGSGLTRAQLAGTAELPESQVDDALVRLSQYVSAPGPEGPFRVYHQSFRDFLLTNHEYLIYPTEANAAIAWFATKTYGRDWLACTDAYALENVVAHLTEVIRSKTQSYLCSDALGRLENLVTNLAYVAARTRCSGAANAEADITTADELVADQPLLSNLRRQLAQIRPLLDRCPTAHDTAIMLVTRLAYVAGPKSLAGELVSQLSLPYVTARHPLPDLSHPALVRALDLPMSACAISAEGTLVAWADKELQMWDTVTGTQLHHITIEIPDGSALSADARTAAFVYDENNRIELWDCATATLDRTLGPLSEPIAACALSADGNIIVTAGRQGTVELWNSRTGGRIDAFPGTVPIAECAVSADGSVVVCHTGSIVNLPTGIDYQRRDTVFADGPVEVRFRDKDGRLPARLAGKAVKAFALSADGQTLLVASADGEDGGSDDRAQFLSFDLISGEQNVIANRDPIDDASCALSFDGRVAAIADEFGQLSIWAADVGDVTVLEESHPTEVELMALSPDGEFAVSAIRNEVSVWDGRARVTRTSPEGRTTWALSPFAADTHILCAVHEGGAEIWDVELGRAVRALPGIEQRLDECAANEDGTVAVTAEWEIGHDDSPSVEVWNLAEPSLRHAVPSAKQPIAMSRDGRLLLVSYKDMRAAVWNIEKARYEPDLLETAEHGSACALAPDGSVAAIGYSNGVFELWPDLRTRLACSARHEQCILHVAFRSDGQTLISSSADGTVKVWDRNGQLLHALPHSDAWVRGCALSPGGRHAVSVDSDGCLKIWELERETCLITQYVHGVLFDCQWLRGGTIVLAGTRGIYLLQATLDR